MELLHTRDQAIHVTGGVGGLAIGVRHRGQKAPSAMRAGAKAIAVARGGVIGERDVMRPVQDVIGGDRASKRISSSLA